MDQYSSYTDGGSRKNPGPAAIGGVIYSPEGEVLAEISDYIGITTNNVAEYTALIETLKKARELDIDKIDCHLDSEFIVKQLNGEYKVKSPDMKPRFMEVLKLSREFSVIRFIHVPREDNEAADAQVNKALDAEGYPKMNGH